MENTNHNRRPTRRHNSVAKIDIDHVISYLSRQFRQRTESYGRVAIRGNTLYELQNDFSYLINGIKRSPSYQASKVIAQANDFLDNIKPAK